MAAGNVVKVNVKWNKEKYDDVELDLGGSVLDFKTTLFSLTGVPPDKMKVMGFKGGILKDTTTWEKAAPKEGMKITVIGTATEAPDRPAVPIKFLEDMTEQEQAKEIKAYASGLENLGNTCYLSANLQCFNAMPELKILLNRFTPSGNDAEKLLVAKLGELFKQLDESPDAVAPLSVVFVFRQLFPQFAEQGPQGGYKQQDAQESWGMLMQVLERNLPGGAFQALFKGEFLETMKCIENPDEEATVNLMPFMQLSCNITNTTNHLTAGLEEGLTGSVDKRSPTLERDAMYSKTARISRLPAYLTVQSVRFQWKAKEGVRAKILRDVKFPKVLDVYNLCTPELQARLDVKRREDEEDEAVPMDEGNSTGGKKNKGKQAEDDDIKPFDVDNVPADGYNTTGKYELHAVVTHVGRQADSGHYVGWVRYKGDHWLQYNDDKVTGTTTEEVLKLSGGGDWHIGYILLYRSVE